MNTPEQAVIQAARDKEWAARFREAADQMDMTAPPPDIDPIIWQAQHDAYIAQARELEGKDDDPCEGGAHCCCCGPGEPCCDCGKIMPAVSQSASEGLFSVQELGALFGTPVGESMVAYAAEVRTIVSLHKRLTRVAETAQAFCAEVCEDSPDVPQPQLKELHAALDRWEARAQPLTEPQRLGQEGEIAQRHREAAARLYLELEEPPYSPKDLAEAEAHRRGDYDAHASVQAFARFEAALSSTALQRETGEPVAWAEGIHWHAPAHRAVMASAKLGTWLSAALDDPNVCEAMKADIREWFSAGEPMETLGQALTALTPAQAEPVAVEALRKCRDQFAFYAAEHKAKAEAAHKEWDDACYWGNVAEQGTKQAEYLKRAKQFETNQEFMVMCDAALPLLGAEERGEG